MVRFSREMARIVDVVDVFVALPINIANADLSTEFADKLSNKQAPRTWIFLAAKSCHDARDTVRETETHGHELNVGYQHLSARRQQSQGSRYIVTMLSALDNLFHRHNRFVEEHDLVSPWIYTTGKLYFKGGNIT